MTAMSDVMRVLAAGRVAGWERTACRVTAEPGPLYGGLRMHVLWAECAATNLVR